MGVAMRIVAVVIIVLIGIPTLLIVMDEFKNAHPTKLLCGRVISRPEEAIEMVAVIKPELLAGVSPASFAKKCGNCSASLREDLDNNWMVSMTFQGRCGGFVEGLWRVRVCGGGAGVLGSMPSSPEGDLCPTCTDRRVPRESG
jgi:hypothetical protein